MNNLPNILQISDKTRTLMKLWFFEHLLECHGSLYENTHSYLYCMGKCCLPSNWSEISLVGKMILITLLRDRKLQAF